MKGAGDAEKDLRARVRRQARHEVALVALDLFARNGFQTTTVGQAAEAAGISRASFFRLFSSKEDAVFAAQEEIGSAIAAALSDRPAEEASWTALKAAFGAATGSYLEDPDLALLRARLILDNPSLRARRLELHAGWAEELCEVVATRDGIAADDLVVEVTVGAAIAAFEVGTARWTKIGGGSLLELIEDAFDAIATLSR
jgi:AcrR family transcriptional regulator